MESAKTTSQARALKGNHLSAAVAIVMQIVCAERAGRALKKEKLELLVDLAQWMVPGIYGLLEGRQQ